MGNTNKDDQHTRECNKYICGHTRNLSVDVRFSEPGHVAVNGCDSVPHPPLPGQTQPRVAVASVRLDPTGSDVHSYISTAALLYAETRPPVIWTAKHHCGWVEIWVDGYKNEGANKGLPKPYCQICLRSECKWCHMCVCSPF